MIEFRGPDNSEFEIINSKVILGHNRLSIIDLNKRSNQPFRYNHLIAVLPEFFFEPFDNLIQNTHLKSNGQILTVKNSCNI